MNLKLISRPVFQDNMQANEIAGFANGCFSIIAQDKKNKQSLFLYNAKGECVIKNLHARNAALLNDNSYIAVEYPNRPKLFDTFTTLYNADGAPMMQLLMDFKIYPNGWYLLKTTARNELYSDKHELIAANFTQCCVYNGGYALRTNPTYYQYANWALFSADGQRIGSCNNVTAILGDGFPLVYDIDKQSFLLMDTSGKKVIANHIDGFLSFPNGRFVLSFYKPLSENKYLKIFNADGTSFVAIDESAICLPDGRFLCQFSHNAFALYRRNGIMSSSSLWQKYQLAGNCYLLYADGISTLFNDKQEDLGEGYQLEAFAENFTLCKNEGAYHLFNQYGAVFSLPLEV